MESTFFSGADCRVILGSPTLQTTNRRVSIPIRMPLNGETFGSMPSWVGTAYQAVSRYLTEASPEVQQVAGLTLAFYNEKREGEMFSAPSAKAPGCELKAFTVMRVGDPDPDTDPEVELHFKAYIPYTRDFWEWIGEMAGKEVQMAFPASVGQEQVGNRATNGTKPLYDDDDLEAERREALKPEHDAEFARGDVPAAPSMESATGEPEAAPAQSSARRRASKSIQ